METHGRTLEQAGILLDEVAQVAQQAGEKSCSEAESAKSRFRGNLGIHLRLIDVLPPLAWTTRARMPRNLPAFRKSSHAHAPD